MTLRGYGSLRRFRASIPFTGYFLTFCAKGEGLTAPPIAQALRREIVSIESAGHWKLLAAVIMPDHAHALVRLGESLSLGQVVARLKSKTKSTLNTYGVSWQGNYYEHRLRPDDSLSDVVRYIYLNPYRAGLVGIHDVWPLFWLSDEVAAWFVPATDDGKPFPQWLA